MAPVNWPTTREREVRALLAADPYRALTLCAIDPSADADYGWAETPVKNAIGLTDTPCIGAGHLDRIVRGVARRQRRFERTAEQLRQAVKQLNRTERAKTVSAKA